MLRLNVRKKKKDTRKYRNFKYLPTWKLEEILADPYCRGIDGADYEPYKGELEDVLNERKEKNYEKDYENQCAQKGEA